MNLELFLQNKWLLLVFAIILLYLGWRIRKAWKNFLFFLLKRRGKRGESVALHILKNEGYTILEEQLILSGKLLENSEEVYYIVKPDFQVEKNGVKFLAEVKTGNSGSIQNKDTRRQLLEYSFLIKNHRVLLVDIETKRIKKIQFSY